MVRAKKLPSGNWNTRVFVGYDAQGKRRYKSITAPSKGECEYLAAEVCFDRKEEKNPTLRECYRKYNQLKSKVLSPSTLRVYQIQAENNMPIMNKLVTNITSADVQKMINDLSLKYAPKTVKNRYGQFSAVMKMFQPGKTFYVKLPPSVRHEIFVPDEEMIKGIYLLLQGKSLEIPFVLASECGLRASEIAGLQYCCIGKDKITIKQAYVDSVEGHTLKQPKTYSGYRDIPCHPEIVKMIGKGNTSDFILPESTRNNISRNWYKFIRSTSYPVFSFHKLRHYFASKLLLKGVPKKYVAEIMGHASEHMLDQVYEHTFKSAKLEFASLVTEVSMFNASQDAT